MGRLDDVIRFPFLPKEDFDRMINNMPSRFEPIEDILSEKNPILTNSPWEKHERLYKQYDRTH